jgi:ubiquinone/menaquinone biosynthesis C-methylase UbiE
MTSQEPTVAGQHGSSTGHALADAEWLDVHFEACRPEYEAAVRSVGIQPGWRVLDAGCGSGSFLPAIAELVGPAGHLAALDLAPENIAIVDTRISEANLECPVETSVGSVLDLPYPDSHFDAVWCANMSQYLTDDEFMGMLAELRRVTKPRGLVAVKDFDATLTQHFPDDPGLLWRFCMARAKVSDMSRGVLRGRGFRRWLERAGFVDVRQETILIERWAPLSPIEWHFLTDLLVYWAEQAEEGAIPEEDQAFWRRLRDPRSLENPINGPEFYWCEANALAVGVVPE